MHIIIFTAFIKAADLFFFFYCPFFFICSTSLTMNSIVFLACHTCTYKPRLYSIPIDEIQKFLFMAKKKKMDSAFHIRFSHTNMGLSSNRVLTTA